MSATAATIAYIRVSTSKQLDGQGPEQQRASICAYAFANDIKIDEWVIEDESGTIEDREQIQCLLTRAKAGEVKTLIVDRVDRLGRRQFVCEKLYADFTQSGVNLVFATLHVDNSTTGVLIRQMMGAIAEYQRSEWLLRMKQCRKLAMARKGTYGGGNVPYGYISIGEGKLAIDEHTAPLVARAFQLASAPGSSFAKIVSILNGEGFRTRKGTLLAPTQISRILKREGFYEGRELLQRVDLATGAGAQHPRILNMHVEQDA